MYCIKIFSKNEKELETKLFVSSAKIHERDIELKNVYFLW